MTASAGSGLPRNRPRKQAAHHALLVELGKNRRAIWSIVALAVLMVGAVAAIVLSTDLKWTRVVDLIARLDPLAVLPAMAVLPLVGFPIALVYLIAGARFGPLWGGVVVAGVTAVHLLGTYVIARSFLRRPLQRFIERRHAQLPGIPHDEQMAVCVIAVLVPGLPYVVRNNLLALAGVQLRFYLGVCLPIYVARSYVAILLGDMSSNPSWNRLLTLVAVEAVRVAVCALALWRLRQHHRRFHGRDAVRCNHEHDALGTPGVG